MVRCDGFTRLELDGEGSLFMHIDMGGRDVVLTHKPPVSWVERADGSRQSLRSNFVLRGPRSFGFSVDGWDRSKPLVLDPGLVWSTYLGGGSSESANAVHWRTGDGVLAAGWTGSMDFPTVPGAFRETGMRDAFVSKLSEDGETLIFSTYLGGSQGEEVRALGVGPGGTVVVAGWTGSPDFPVTAGAFQPEFGGASPLVSIGDGFVLSLSADGSRLLQSSFLGGNQDEVVEALHVDEGGGLVLVGQTGSIDFPTTPGAAQPNLSSPEVIADGFVSGIAADGRLRFSTYVGGADWDQLNAVDVNPSGITTAVGYTASSNFPTAPDSLQPDLRGFTDAVVVQLDAAEGA